MRGLALLALAATLALLVGGAGSSATRVEDHAAVAFNILAPGQSGSLAVERTSIDQLRLFDALTPRGANVRDRDLRRFFKPAWFGLRGTRAARVVRPRHGVKITRDTWGVAHVEGRTDRDVAFGAGWATAEDRGLFLQLIRGPGRLAALDVPNVNPLGVLGRSFTTTPQTEAFLATQTQLLRRAGRKGRETLRTLDAYVAGINAYFRSRGITGSRWTRNDSYAAGALIASQFGRGGGDEARRSLFLSALQQQLGAERGRAVWDDLRQQHDADAPVSAPGRFAYGTTSSPSRGSVVLDDGSYRPASASVGGATRRYSMSNGLVVSARRSRTGRPLFVSGPQIGFSYPASFTELDLHGGGIHARGISFPGVFGILTGRGHDFVFSAQSSHADTTDQYVETICGDGASYSYRGRCRPMGTFDAGTLGGQRLVFRTTVHGPVAGYATTGGRSVAISSKRANRGREILTTFAFQDVNRNRVRSAGQFLRAMNQVEFSFNWVYADDRDIAYFSAGRLPLRPAGTDMGLPTVGTGEYEWRGFAPFRAHPRAINPPQGWIAAWNNRPAQGFAAPDDTWSWGSVQRVQLLQIGLRGGRRHTLGTVVGAMNRAATQDARAVLVWPQISGVLGTAPAPSVRAQQARALVDEWRSLRSHRVDGNLDGKIDHPGAAILDAAWPKLAEAAMRPVLGELLPRLRQLHGWDDAANSQGSAYDTGWYGYVEKDLRRFFRPVRQAFGVRYCGLGDLAVCRASLWAAMEEAVAELSAVQGPDPAQWRADATRERITFAGGVMRETMRFANRPTFQQVMSFDSHRRRPRR